MGINQKRRQKQLEKRRAKRNVERKAYARRNQGGLAARLAAVSDAPVLHSCIAAAVWESGIGQVLLSRTLPGRQVAFANFLVDVYCLGVKDVMADIAAQSMYMNKLYTKLANKFPLRKVSPAYVRKLVEGAVAYAQNLSLPPHPQYDMARNIFGEIDPAECRETFSFGHDGKPFFISGPYDSPEKCRRIVSILHSVCGPDNYHFLMAVPPDEMAFEDLGLECEDDQ